MTYQLGMPSTTFFQAFASAVVQASSNIAYWLICFTYIKVVLDTKSLLDKDIYLNNRSKLERSERYKRWLVIANWFNIVMSIILGSCRYVGKRDAGSVAAVIYKFGETTELAFQWIYFIVWGLMLIFLYRSVQSARNLLP